MVRWFTQAIEAKEGVEIKSENQTVASISYQNYFRLCDKLAGMTGTADTEAFEFQQIYGLETVVIPTNRPMIRDDRMDVMRLRMRNTNSMRLLRISKTVSHAINRFLLVLYLLKNLKCFLKR